MSPLVETTKGGDAYDLGKLKYNSKNINPKINTIRKRSNMSNNQTPLRIEGYLGKDPEMRYTPNGKGLVEFSVADTYSWKNERGEWQDITTWFRCTAWGESRAEYVSKYYKKGDPVIVEGRLQPDKETGGPRVYKREDGTHGAQFDVTIQNIRKMMQRKNGDTSHSDEHIDISLGTNANEEISFID